ncbi:winged helix-turn-helix transcriptional regulator [Leucobacter luti]|uniref:DNA-binding response OmpR family regulator n=1 Tax=Leucobacter luti TaxID=340320 RepID=A0A4Q7TYI5_9MICO|nr:response regulator transcription factor [Leucobacter luti]MBL3698827.1 DNA-binding response regulator [Leucobacter luti]RZT66205.1 DNA-binding response OmpR family regulator [Leucobacter luti]
MQLLCLTDRDPAESLPGLDLLPHDVRTSPLSLRVPETLAARYDALLIDGTLDARRARAACLGLKAGANTPRVVILPEVALTALTVEWGVSELLLPTASPAEIEVRLRLLEQPASQSPPPAVQAAGVVIDESNFTARLFGRPLDLTYKEFELLHFLAGNPGRVFTRDQLLSEVWGTDYFGGTRTVDVHVRRLRAKLGDHEALISTVRGVGYGFARSRIDDEEAPA